MNNKSENVILSFRHCEKYPEGAIWQIDGENGDTLVLIRTNMPSDLSQTVRTSAKWSISSLAVVVGSLKAATAFFNCFMEIKSVAFAQFQANCNISVLIDYTVVMLNSGIKRVNAHLFLFLSAKKTAFVTKQKAHEEKQHSFLSYNMMQL